MDVATEARAQRPRSRVERGQEARTARPTKKSRYHHNVYAKSKTSRYLVIFDVQRKIIDCQRLEASADLRGAMTAAIDRLSQDGWRPEGTPDFGFVFLNRNGIRRLLILTERDPLDTRPQAFSPFK
jgi:hypothetical protein